MKKSQFTDQQIAFTLQQAVAGVAVEGVAVEDEGLDDIDTFTAPTGCPELG